MSDLTALFTAQSVAVVGASANPEKLGYTILANIKQGGYAGKIYPINPRTEEILGYKCYPSIAKIPGGVDLAVIVVPNRLVPGVLEEAGQAGVQAVIVITGGFRESGEVELEQQIQAIVKRYTMRMLGPNCQGLNYTPNKLCATWPLIKAQGGMAIISQSGSVGAELGILAEQEGIGVSSIVSLGNKADVNELDLLRFFAADEHTKSIALYIEAITNGKAFLDTMALISGKKPVAILKPGKTAAGRKAAETHTNSVTGRREVFEAVCKQYGLVNADNLEEFYDCAKGLSMLSRPKGKRIQVLTSTGGGGVLASDAISEGNLEMAEIAGDLKQQLQKEFPDRFTIGNPFDLTGDATAHTYEEAILQLSADANIDVFLVIVGDPIPGVAEVLAGLRKQIEQELVVCFFGGGEVQRSETLKMHQLGIPVFPTPERAVNVIAKIMGSK
ncbi:MAG: acetate--CoA ligase family protein [bacterium]|jgi:acetyl coenzyme A synthetase (ADP forming)-like protein